MISSLLLIAFLAQSPATPSDFVGTWELVEAEYDGKPSGLPKVMRVVKHVTPTHYVWLRISDTGRVVWSGGGVWWLEGDAFCTSSRYGVGKDYRRVSNFPKKSFSYTLDLKSKRWIHSGTLKDGTLIYEIWKRLERTEEHAPQNHGRPADGK